MEHKQPMKHIELITRIVDAAISAQNAGICTSFVEISGHVQQITVRLFFPVWVADMNPSHTFSVYLDRENNDYWLDEMLSEINECINSHSSPIQSETEVSEG